MAFLTFFLIFSGEKRKTMNKNFSFEFTKTESGWLDFEIHIQNATFHYFFSDDINTQPEELIIWLEKFITKIIANLNVKQKIFLFGSITTERNFGYMTKLIYLENPKKTGFINIFMELWKFQELIYAQ